MNNNLNKQTALTENGATVNGRGDSPNQHDILTGSTLDGRELEDSANHTCSNWVGVTFNGTTNEIELTTNTFTTVGGGGTVTIGLPDDVVIGNDLTVTGDLTVFGTASFQNTENLVVADRFLLLASGSNTAGDGGIVVQQNTQDVGELFGFDSATSRWAVTSSFSADASAYTPDAFMATALVGTGTDPNAVASRYDAKGNIFVGTDEEIWIYA